MEFVGLLFGMEFMVLLCIYYCYCYIAEEASSEVLLFDDDDGNGSKFKGGLILVAVFDVSEVVLRSGTNFCFLRINQGADALLFGLNSRQ